MGFILPKLSSKPGGGEHMVNPAKNGSFVFIVGSPRSGTTIFGELLDIHPQLSQWYEPYFVWDRYFRLAPHDERTAADATARVKGQIFGDFDRYRKNKRCLVLIDKSPRNSLKIPFILKIFPRARFVHLFRDGRDVTLSIHKEWQRRRIIVNDPDQQGRFNYFKALGVLKNFLARQTFMQDKLKALWFETHGQFINKTKQLNRLRWHGEIGWGPRFKNWREVYSQSSLLQFNAHQWRACVQCIQRDWGLIQPQNRLTVRYEDLITNPKTKINEILDFIGVKSSKDFMASLPELKASNYNKWKNEFTKGQLKKIYSILTPQLQQLGYAGSEEWLNQN
jgi:hypothetical protein